MVDVVVVGMVVVVSFVINSDAEDAADDDDDDDDDDTADDDIAMVATDNEEEVVCLPPLLLLLLLLLVLPPLLLSLAIPAMVPSSPHDSSGLLNRVCIPRRTSACTGGKYFDKGSISLSGGTPLSLSQPAIEAVKAAVNFRFRMPSTPYT